MNRFASPPRAGKSLVELLVVLSIVSAIFLMVGRMVTTLFRIEEAEVRSFRQSEQASRLADQFRRDVQSARRVEGDAPDGADSLRLVLSEGQGVEYLWGEPVVRRQKRGEAVESTDAYSLPNAFVQCDADATGGRVLLRVFRRPPAVASPKPVVGENSARTQGGRLLLRVEASVAFDLRLGEPPTP